MPEQIFMPEQLPYLSLIVHLWNYPGAPTLTAYECAKPKSLFSLASANVFKITVLNLQVSMFDLPLYVTGRAHQGTSGYYELHSCSQ